MRRQGHKWVIWAICLVCCAFIMSVPAMLGIAVCVWYSGGCVVTAMQASWGFEAIGWSLQITCYDGGGGYWSGSGAWGGECNGISFDLM